MSVSVMPRTLNGSVYPFLSQKIRTSLPKFKANDSVYIVSRPLRTLNASYTPHQAFNLPISLITLAMVLAYYYCGDKGSKSITMRG